MVATYAGPQYTVEPTLIEISTSKPGVKLSPTLRRYMQQTIGGLGSSDSYISFQMIQAPAPQSKTACS